jgi:hypothetical protein
LEIKRLYTADEIKEINVPILTEIPFPSKKQCLVHFDIYIELKNLQPFEKPHYLYNYPYVNGWIYSNKYHSLFNIEYSFYLEYKKAFELGFWTDFDLDEILGFDIEELTLKCVGFTIANDETIMEPLHRIRPLYDVRSLKEYQAYQLTNIFSSKEH